MRNIILLLVCTIYLSGNSNAFRVFDFSNEIKVNASKHRELENYYQYTNEKVNRRYLNLALKDDDTPDCNSSSSDDFPHFVMNDDQLESGGVVLCFFIGIYCFNFLAIICDKYFLPCVEEICVALNVSPDVAAATFMSTATAAPETFVNVIGTFITQSDLGIGTIVGALMFNTLGVAGIGGLATKKPVQLHWWPLTRDAFSYTLAICLLIAVSWDGVIYWYESVILCVFYITYFTLQFQNKKIVRLVKRALKKIKGTNQVAEEIELPEQKKMSVISHSSYLGSYAEEPIHDVENVSIQSDDEDDNIFSIPKGFWSKLGYFYIFPIKFLLHFTVPNVRRIRKIYPLTFIICVVYIAASSYVVSWMICLIGDVFNIPDSVLGLTFLAAGSCVPEGISLFIMVSQRGEGAFGVSNSLGANTMDVSLSLGLPWFTKTMIQLSKQQSNFVVIQSGSIEYSIILLAVGSVTLYVTLCAFKFKLRKRVGGILMFVYIICVTFAILFELVFFKSDCASAA